MKTWRNGVIRVFAAGAMTVTGAMGADGVPAAVEGEVDRPNGEAVPFPEQPYAYLPQPFINDYMERGPFYAYSRHSPDFRGGYPPEYRGGYPPEFRGGYPPEYRGGYPPEYRGEPALEWGSRKMDRARPPVESK